MLIEYAQKSSSHLMSPRIAIIGSGPTGIYTLCGLISGRVPIQITVFEAEAEPGKGTPYHPHSNDRAMLANIASFELPSICETLVGWLSRQSDAELERLGVLRSVIDDREFFPRVVLGEYFRSQFLQLVDMAFAKGNTVDVKSSHRVVDITLRSQDIALTTRTPDGSLGDYAFEHVVMATGHNWPDNTETTPGYFVSPWPASNLKSIGACAVGILGTSLSAIDALVSVATANGAFLLDVAGELQFQSGEDSKAFHVTLMSRKGLLPEADFYFEFPFAPLRYCNDAAVDNLIARSGRTGLLDGIFDLFRLELTASDPQYAASIGLALLSVETFADAYFAARSNAEPFVWAASNLAESQQNKASHFTVEWRYAILRMHEVVGRAVRHLDTTDLARFHKSFKTIFVDDYATVPHQSVQRLLALRRAGKVDVVRLGHDYTIDHETVERGAVVRAGNATFEFEAFIDATGQTSLSAHDLPFPGLVEHGLLRRAVTAVKSLAIEADERCDFERTGGIDIDETFRPAFTKGLCRDLYCVAISFLLHKMPFVQGIPSAQELGQIVSASILESMGEEPISPERDAPVPSLIIAG